MIGEGATQTLSKPHRLNSYPVPAWSAAQTPYVQRALPFYGHYDVTTSWDFEHPALNTDAYSPELGYSRHMVSYVPFSSNEGPLAGGVGLKLKAGPGERNRPLGEVPGVDPALTITGPLAAKFSSLTIGQRVEIQELCKWAYEVRPRGVQDIKPLLVLLQGLLRDLLHEKYVLPILFPVLSLGARGSPLSDDDERLFSNASSTLPPITPSSMLYLSSLYAATMDSGSRKLSNPTHIAIFAPSKFI